MNANPKFNDMYTVQDDTINKRMAGSESRAV